MHNIENSEYNLKDLVFICQTDTLYGICTSAFDKENVEYIYSIKGRKKDKPFIILISKISDLKRFGIDISSKQKIFLEKVWPGKVSVILPCSDKKFDYLHRGTESLAFRIPKKVSIRDIMETTGPLVAPSVNKEGKTPAATITEARAIFDDQIDLYISGGKLNGAPSTIVTFKDHELVCLREGAVSFESLNAIFSSISE